jgi:hypothetical protein
MVMDGFWLLLLLGKCAPNPPMGLLRLDFIPIVDWERSLKMEFNPEISDQSGPISLFEINLESSQINLNIMTTLSLTFVCSAEILTKCVPILPLSSGVSPTRGKVQIFGTGPRRGAAAGGSRCLCATPPSVSSPLSTSLGAHRRLLTWRPSTAFPDAGGSRTVATRPPQLGERAVAWPRSQANATARLH